MASWEVRLTWLNCNQRSEFGWTLREDVRPACAQTPELFFEQHVPFQLSAKEQKYNFNMQMYTGTRLMTAIHRRLLSRFWNSLPLDGSLNDHG